MWRSLGDKTDIERHDEEKHPRSVRTNVPAIIILLIVFAVNSFTGSETISRWAGPDAFPTIQAIVCIAAAICSLLLAGWKFQRNNHEVDLLLIGMALLYLVIYFSFR